MDDTVVLIVGATVEGATKKLKNYTKNVSRCTREWRLTLNELRSVNIHITNRKTLNETSILLNKINKKSQCHMKIVLRTWVLGVNLDAKLRWKNHIKIKMIEQDFRQKMCG